MKIRYLEDVFFATHTVYKTILTFNRVQDLFCGLPSPVQVLADGEPISCTFSQQDKMRFEGRFVTARRSFAKVRYSDRFVSLNPSPYPADHMGKLRNYAKATKDLDLNSYWLWLNKQKNIKKSLLIIKEEHQDCLKRLFSIFHNLEQAQYILLDKLGKDEVDIVDGSFTVRLRRNRALNNK